MSLGGAILWFLFAFRDNAFAVDTKISGKPLPLYKHSDSYDAYSLPFKRLGPYRVSSNFGLRQHPIKGRVLRHEGIDFSLRFGTPVYPSRSGIVTFVGWRGGYGWMVEIKHQDGMQTIYGHLTRAFFIVGQLVHRDMLLGLVGNSGQTTGPHLHFEIRDRLGRAIDPRKVIGLL